MPETRDPNYPFLPGAWLDAAADREREVREEGTRTIDGGFELLRWIDGVVDGRIFYGASAVQHAYDRGGWEAVIERANEAVRACDAFASTTILPCTNDELRAVWSDIADGARLVIADAVGVGGYVQ